MDDPARPVLDERQHHHLTRVLRLRAGEVVVAADGRGRWATCRFDGAGDVVAEGRVVAEPRPVPALTVAFAPVKGERPEHTVAQLTELGVDRIVVLGAARSVVRWRGGRSEVALSRLRRAAGEAACQSRRTWLPEVDGVLSLSDLAGRLPDGSCLAVAEPGGPPLPRRITAIAVGPEGGWAPDELGLDLPEVGLGPHVLRSGTAAITAGALLVARRAGTVS